ncbi:MAG: transcriptional regulator [Boseongicola sp.]|nr:MAG: transcriptional regulator [Boseongicola sp.]
MHYDAQERSPIMTSKPYGLVCPITHACDILEPRWTMPILSEMWAGATRFNDIRRGVGNISPALLSRRLKELELHGLIERVEDPASGNVDYIRTDRAVALEPALNALALWAQSNIAARQALLDADLSTFMWKMRNYFLRDQLPDRQVVIRFHFTDPDLAYDTYWALLRPGQPVEMCTDIPGFDVDLYVETSKISLASILLGRTTVSRETDAERMYLSGDAMLAKTMQRWIFVSGYAKADGLMMLDDTPN